MSHSSSSLFSFYASSLLSYKTVGYQVLCENQPEFIQSFPDYSSSCLTRPVWRRGLCLCGPHDSFTYSAFEVAWMYRVGQGLTPFPLGKPRAPMVLSCPSSNFPCPCLLAPGGFSPAWYPWSSIYLHWLLSFALSQLESSSPLLISVINCEADNMYTTRIKPFLLTFQ